jgi:hypothetical protein
LRRQGLLAASLHALLRSLQRHFILENVQMFFQFSIVVIINELFLAVQALLVVLIDVKSVSLRIKILVIGRLLGSNFRFLCQSVVGMMNFSASLRLSLTATFLVF